MPLDVWKNIELPQLQLVENYTNDCTQVYATGESGYRRVSSATRLPVFMAQITAAPFD